MFSPGTDGLGEGRSEGFQRVQRIFDFSLRHVNITAHAD